MGWARIDDGFDDHQKVLALLEEEDGLAAIGMWTLCLSYARRVTTRKGRIPGLISTALPRRYAGVQGRELADLLVRVKLWDIHPDGWMIHNFPKYGPSATLSQARAEAGKRGARARWEAPGPSDGPATPGSQNGMEPSDDGMEPSDDGKPMANDGSRADARPRPHSHTQTHTQRANPPPSGPPPTRGTRLPDPFDLTEEMIEWARKNAPRAHPDDHEAFKDYFRSAPGQKGVKLDWIATWRNWMRKENERRHGPPNGGGPQPSTTDRKVAQTLELAEQFKNYEQKEIGS